MKIDNSHLIIDVDISYTVATASLKCFQASYDCILNQVSCHASLVTFAGNRVQISRTIAVTDINDCKWEEF